jgi:FkbM family methyltransferase
LVNCGCCDGKTLLDFYQYNGDSFSKLIGIDCVKKNIFNSTSLMIQNNVPKNRYEILYYALGEREDTIFVKDEGMYRASEKGKPNGSEVKQVTLDNLFKNKKPYTFLALDTEGFEMGILKGSEKIIKEAKPKLAISIYHRFDDIFEIILYLHKLNPQYKFSAICD